MSFGNISLRRRALAALAALALVVSSAPLGGTEAQAAVSDWHRGVSIVSRSSTDFESENFKQSVRNAKDMGSNYVTLIIPYMQDNYQSSNIYNHWNTPSESTLGAAIDYIHSQGMKVALKPHLEVSFNGWRALIEASDRNAWYASYGAMLNRLGDLGKRHGAEMIVVGTELIGMASPYVHPNNTERWVSMIGDLRSRYSGLLTYSANWGRGINHTNEFEQIGFWSSLDYIGISAYFELQTDNSVSSLKNAWSTIERDQIGPLASRVGKPVVFTEIGYRSVDNAHYRPWDYEMGGNYNPGEQQNAYQALIEFWNAKSYFAGVMLWDWSSDPNYGGQGNTDYTPRGKPAESLIKSLYAATNPTPAPNPNPTPSPSPSPSPSPTPSPAPTGSWSAAASTPGGAQPGSPTSFQVTVMNSGTAQNVISDIEIYDAANSKVFQKFFEGQNISQSTPGKYSISFTPPVAGNYTLKVGVFNNNWSTNYYWGDNVLPFTAGSASNPTPSPSPSPSPSPAPTPTTYTTDIWWPSDGAAINGVQPFKAMLQDKPISEYQMFWQVDGGMEIEMGNSDVDWPHKETLVDVSAWKWKGEGPYRIRFVSKSGGAIIGDRSIDVYVR